MAPVSGTSLLRCSSVCSRFVSRSSRQARYITSKPLISTDTVIPPDSPRYVFLPESPQQRPIVRKQRSGTLPVPRLPKKIRKKETEWHLENTAPEPISNKTKNVREHHKELADWKAEESRLRRTNYLSGYTGIHRREQRMNKIRSARRAEGLEDRKEAREHPEHFYEEMSRPSVLSYMNNKSTWRHPRRTAEEVAERRAGLAELEAAKEYERRTTMHTLYINAKDFIVNTEQLEARLTEVFESDFYVYNRANDLGIWDEEGHPEDTTYLLTTALRSSASKDQTATSGYTETARRRIMKVTEEMTGGKLVLEKKVSGLS